MMSATKSLLKSVFGNFEPRALKTSGDRGLLLCDLFLSLCALLRSRALVPARVGITGECSCCLGLLASNPMFYEIKSWFGLTYEFGLLPFRFPAF